MKFSGLSQSAAEFSQNLFNFVGIAGNSIKLLEISECSKDSQGKFKKLRIKCLPNLAKRDRDPRVGIGSFPAAMKIECPRPFQRSSAFHGQVVNAYRSKTPCRLVSGSQSVDSPCGVPAG